jgi:hypothetical protein
MLSRTWVLDNTAQVSNNGEVHPIIGHEGPEGKLRYSWILSLTSALDGGGRSTPFPGRYTSTPHPPEEGQVPIAQEAGWWAPRPVWTRAENLARSGIQSPDRPARNESLYWLCSPDPLSNKGQILSRIGNCARVINNGQQRRNFTQCPGLNIWYSTRIVNSGQIWNNNTN